MEFYIICAVVVVALAGIFFTKNFRARLFGANFEKHQGKDNVKVTRLKSKADVEITSKEGQNIEVDKIDNSTLKINPPKK